MNIERFKNNEKCPMYGVVIYYGEDIGCDDFDIKPEERTVKIIGNPVGCLGEVRVLFVGQVKDIDTFNFNICPIKVSNPPKKDIFNEPGYYMWGTEESIKHISEKFTERKIWDNFDDGKNGHSKYEIINKGR